MIINAEDRFRRKTVWSGACDGTIYADRNNMTGATITVNHVKKGVDNSETLVYSSNSSDQLFFLCDSGGKKNAYKNNTGMHRVQAPQLWHNEG